jgi:hypothetical protein
MQVCNHAREFFNAKEICKNPNDEDTLSTRQEALFMLIMYGVYCIALRFNTTLERWAMTLPLPFKLPTREEQAALVTYK